MPYEIRECILLILCCLDLEVSIHKAHTVYYCRIISPLLLRTNSDLGYNLSECSSHHKCEPFWFILFHTHGIENNFSEIWVSFPYLRTCWDLLNQTKSLFLYKEAHPYRNREASTLCLLIITTLQLGLRE